MQLRKKPLAQGTRKSKENYTLLLSLVLPSTRPPPPPVEKTRNLFILLVFFGGGGFFSVLFLSLSILCVIERGISYIIQQASGRAKTVESRLVFFFCCCSLRKLNPVNPKILPTSSLSIYCFAESLQK